MPSIFSFTHDQFCNFVYSKLGKGKQHALSIYSSWFRKGVLDCSDPIFSNCPALFDDIVSLFDTVLPTLKCVNEYDTTKKILLQTHDGLEYEAVIIPMRFGSTLCVSSQVGCKMGCTFCETGRMGLIRNLSVEEIIAPLFIAKFHLNVKIRNIVFMGMGEPFDNFDAVIKAVKVFLDPFAFALAASKITISTSGRVDGIKKLIELKDPIINLAVSINAPSDEKRKKIMPVTRQYSMQELKEVMLAYTKAFNRQILAEYVMIENFNDSLQDAEILAHYLKGLDVKVNLIPYNAQSNPRFKPSDFETIKLFGGKLRELGYYTLWRLPKGRDIMAACGQLGNIALKKRLKDSVSMQEYP